MSSLQNNPRIALRYGSRDNVDETARLPKTMVHWFREHGIKFHAESGVGYGTRKSLVEGCGTSVRHFRALPHLGLIQICDGYFDRWANSVGTETSLPKTRAEFATAIEHLLSHSKIAKIDPEVELESLLRDLETVDRDVAELRNENLDLESHVRYFGRSKRWIARLWSRYQRELSYLHWKRDRIVKKIRFQRMRIAAA
jgi:hypothetical protein